MSGVILRDLLQPGDLGAIVEMHGVIYAREYGLDTTFEPYVAEPLCQFVRAGEGAGRIWIAERDGHRLGCIAVIRDAPDIAQLRWFLLAPEARGTGLGRRLLDTCLDYARGQGFARVYLWTFEGLDAATQLYRARGFVDTERKVHERLWGRQITELRMDADLRASN